MSRIRTRKWLLLGVFVVLVLAAGFAQLSLRSQGRIIETATLGDWPLEWAARRQFARKQPELQAVIDFVNEAPEIEGLRVTPSGLRASLQGNSSEQHELTQPNIVQALVSIEALLVQVEEGVVKIALGSEFRGPTQFDVGFWHHERALSMPDCDTVAPREKPAIGSCYMALGPNWSVRYMWYPHDIEELEKALGEME